MSLPDSDRAATQPSAARRPGPGTLLLDWARRKPALALMTVVNLLITALAIALVTWKWRDADDQRQQKEAALADAAANRYITQIARAEREWLANHVAAADRILEECPPALRGWEWRYLKRLCHSEWFTLTGPANLHHILFTPDGQRLLALGVNLDPAGKRQVVVVKAWDSTAATELKSLKLPGNPVLTLLAPPAPLSHGILSPDGRYLALVATPGDPGGVSAAKIVEIATGREIAFFNGHSQAISSMVFSPDGRRVASASIREVKVWEAATGKQVLSLPQNRARVSGARFSPDPENRAGVGGVTFSPDGQHLAVLGVLTIQVWDTTTGKESLTLNFAQSPGAGIPTKGLVYSPDGRQLALAHGTEVHVWETATAKEVSTLYGRDFRFQSVTYSPDGQYLASANDDQTVRIWDADTGQETLVLRGHTRDVNLVAYSPEGRRLASAASDGTIKIWDVTISRKASPSAGSAQGTAFMAMSPDGLWLAKVPIYGASRVIIRNVLTGDEETWPLTGFAGSVMAVAFSPDSQRLALSCFGAHGQDKIETQIRFLDVAGGREIGVLEKLTGPISYLAYSPDGKRLATAGYQSGLRVWDLASAKELLTLEDKDVTGMVFSPDGQQLASAAGDKTVKIWDATSGQELLGTRPLADIVRRLAYSPDGQRLTTASLLEVKVWDAHTGQEITAAGDFRRGSLPDGAHRFALSPDGQRVAAVSQGALRIWDAMSGQEVFTLVRSAGVGKLAFSANGQRLVTPEQVWDAEPLTPEVVAARLPSWEKAALRWHFQEAEQARLRGRRFAAQFHLQRLAKERKRLHDREHTEHSK